MLVLSRKAAEEILIADHIRIKVLKINGNRVQLGIEAPLDVRIERAELQNKNPLERKWQVQLEHAG